MRTVNQEEQLTRIADALERIGNGIMNIDVSLKSVNNRLDDIACSLDSLNGKLSRCIFTDGKEDFLHIAGIIETQ